VYAAEQEHRPFPSGLREWPADHVDRRIALVFAQRRGEVARVTLHWEIGHVDVGEHNVKTCRRSSRDSGRWADYSITC
jgi:hypothetical protein